MDSNSTTIGVWTELAEASTEVKNVAKKLALEVTDKNDLVLIKSAIGWRLSSQIENLSGEIYIDFTAGKNVRRQKHPGAGKQPLAKAVGIKKNQRPTILDATAGLGGDAYLLAALGCKVWLCERNPIVATLLNDAIQRAKSHPETSSLFLNSMLFAGATIDQAQNILNEPPDVIYLDPMYPKPNKNRSANVKKEMQLMRVLLAADIDAAEWLQKARKWSKKVIVKRPTWAAPLATDLHGTVKTKNHRYDIFMNPQ